MNQSINFFSFLTIISLTKLFVKNKKYEINECYEGKEREEERSEWSKKDKGILMFFKYY